jgi:hypothetical protein
MDGWMDGVHHHTSTSNIAGPQHSRSSSSSSSSSSSLGVQDYCQLMLEDRAENSEALYIHLKGRGFVSQSYLDSL